MHLRITSDVPSRASTGIFIVPALFLSSVLCSLYSGHSRRKCSTVSSPVPHSQSGLSARPNRCRYELRLQCPVLSCIIFDVLQDSLLYSVRPSWFPFRWRICFRRDGGPAELRFIHCSWAAAFISLIRERFCICAVCFAISSASYRCSSVVGHHGGLVKGNY